MTTTADLVRAMRRTRRLRDRVADEVEAGRRTDILVTAFRAPSWSKYLRAIRWELELIDKFIDEQHWSEWYEQNKQQPTPEGDRGTPESDRDPGR